MDKKFIKMVRSFYGVTQEDVAKSAGVSRDTVRRFETGSSNNQKVERYYQKMYDGMINTLAHEKYSEGWWPV